MNAAPATIAVRTVLLLFMLPPDPRV